MNFFVGSMLFHFRVTYGGIFGGDYYGDGDHCGGCAEKGAPDCNGIRVRVSNYYYIHYCIPLSLLDLSHTLNYTKNH